MRRHALPVLLLASCTAAFGGLAALSPQPTLARATAAAPAASPESMAMTLQARVELDREASSARASRGRRIVEAEAARIAAEQAAAEAARIAAEQAAAEAAARAKAEAEAAASAKAAKKAAAEKAAADKAARKAEEKKAAKQAASQAAAPAGRSSGGMACPVPNASFSDTYGASRSGGRSHKGTDMMAPAGSPIYAVVSGRIRTASSALGGISLYLHGDNGETYFYAHNSSNVAGNGARVAAGDLIAKVGSTGNAGGTNHLHFERQTGGGSVNPYAFLRKIC